MRLADMETQPITGTPRCSIGAALTSLDDEDADTLQRWLDDPDKSARWIKWALGEAECRVTVGLQTVGRHRRNECSCT